MLKWDSRVANQRSSGFPAAALAATEGGPAARGGRARAWWPRAIGRCAPAASAMLRCEQWKKRDPLPSLSSVVPSEGAAGGGAGLLVFVLVAQYRCSAGTTRVTAWPVDMAARIAADPIMYCLPPRRGPRRGALVHTTRAISNKNKRKASFCRLEFQFNARFGNVTAKVF